MKNRLSKTESKLDETKRNKLLGVIRKIFTELISKYDNFTEKLKQKKQMDGQPHILITKAHNSNEILLEEYIWVLTDEFKEKFPEN